MITSRAIMRVARFEPGDMTSYLAIFTPVDHAAEGGGRDWWILSFPNSHLCVGFEAGGFLSLEDLQDNIPDANPWTLRAMVEIVHLHFEMASPPPATVKDWQEGRGQG